MTQHRYPARIVILDYLRGAAGGVISLLALMLSTGILISTLIFGALTALFLVFTIRTLLRHRLRLDVSDEAIGLAGAPGRAIEWARLEGARLRYFGTRRGRGEGWMTLTLKSGSRRLTLDSTIEDFPAIAARAAAAVRANRLDTDAVTAANFAALGLALDGAGSSPSDQAP